MHVEPLERRELLNADSVIISEFMASNDATNVDQFGLSSDWIELFNPTDSAISLSGWHLTDDVENQDKWTFPDVTLDSGQFLLIYASGEDVTDPAEPWMHTNFRLSAGGEYLALIKSDMTVVQEFAEEFPPQFADISFGVGATSFPAVPDDATFSYHVPVEADSALAPSGGWSHLDFDDAAWTVSDGVSVTGGVGYAIGNAAEDFESHISTNVEGQMFLKNSSLWIRQEFEVADVADYNGLLMNVQFDDAFVAYLNGERVAEMFPPEGELTWNAESDMPRRDARRWDPLGVHEFDLGEHTGQLVQGTNVLAIHLMNESNFEEDVFVRATLTGITLATEANAESIGYLAEATPGSANRPLRGGAASLSVASQIFTDPLTVEVTGSVEGQTIRYTTDGTDPTVASPEYTGPIQIAGTTTLRATQFAPDGSAGPVAYASYVHLADDAETLSFETNLPLIVFNSEVSAILPVSRIPDAAQNRDPVSSFVSVIEPDETGRTRLSGDTVLNTRAGINRRGSSTAGNNKLNLAVEFWDNSGSDTTHELLGMPADADWVFYAPYNFDRTKGIRNSFFYEISNQIGRWASRTRLVEVFHNVAGDDLTAEDYQGIYVIIEKIQRGENRVNVEKLGPDDLAEPDITGGWIWKVDRADPGDSGFSAGGQSIKWVNPKETEVEAVSEQVQWARDFFNNMNRVFRDRDSTMEQIREIIDVESWIDHAIINTITFNLDAYRLSGYFHKDRGGLLEMGPVWDCDRCMGSEDSRDNDPEVWHSRVSDYGTDFFGYPWWRDLYRNQPDFWQAWIDRWFDLRDEVLSDANMTAIVDSFASQLVEAHPRDTAKWTVNRPNGGSYAPRDMRNWEGEVIHLKGFNLARAHWIDERFVARVDITPDGGNLDTGQPVSMSAAAGTIYYTTDGTDPRAPGGEVAPTAMIYTDPITVDSTATVIARAFDDSEPVELNPNRTHNDPRSGSFWSAPRTVHFSDTAVATASNFRISEVNYHPTDATPQELQTLGVEQLSGDEFEFIEFTNTGDEPINLEGVELVRVAAFDRLAGVDFKFDAQMLDPGERIVVVENVDAFRARYGTSARIAQGTDGTENATSGQYGGRLENLGESLKAVDQHGGLILRMSYDDAGPWPTRADGGGSSLELIDAHGDVHDPANWRASIEYGGSPGTAGDEFAERIVVTELLTNTDQPQGDMLELHNTSGGDIDITGWIISNGESGSEEFSVTEPTVIPAGGYAVLTEQQMGFGFDAARGGQVMIVEADSTGPVRFANATQYPNSALNVSLGRWPDVHGEFFPMAQMTFGSANSGIRPGDVIISEVHYSPIDPDGNGRQDSEDFEFIELFNQTGSTIDLNGWRLTGDGVDWQFEESTTLESGETISLVPFNPVSRPNDATVFRFFFGVPNSVQLAGDFRESRRTSLEDDGAHLLLEQPGAAPADDPTFTPYIWVDELTYTNEAPWPADISENGNSLTRVSGQEPGFFPTNWTSKPVSLGSVEFIVRPVGDANEDGVFDQSDLVAVLQAGKYLTDQPATFGEGDWNGDGRFDERDLVLALQTGAFAGAFEARTVDSESLLAKSGGREVSGPLLPDAVDDALQHDPLEDEDPVFLRLI